MDYDKMHESYSSRKKGSISGQNSLNFIQKLINQNKILNFIQKLINHPNFSLPINEY